MDLGGEGAKGGGGFCKRDRSGSTEWCIWCVREGGTLMLAIHRNSKADQVIHSK